MDKISSAITCSNCRHVLSRPVLLPCGHSVCKAHIDQSDDDSIICNKCSQKHSNCGNFVVIESLSEVIAQINSLDLGESHKEARKSCDNLKDVISQIDAFLKDPDFFIFEFIGEFRRRVDLKREEYKLKLEQETQHILTQLDKLEADCKENLKTSNEFKELRSAKEEAQQQLDEYLCALNELKVDIDKWKRIKELFDLKVKCLKKNFSEFQQCFFELDPEIGKSEFHVQIDIDTACEFRRIKGDSKIKIDSNILNNDQKMKFVKLCEFDVDTKFDLLYRGSRDGFGAQDFHAKCDNKPKTVTIIKSTNNNVFGGYTEASWDSSFAYGRDPNAFLFSLVNQHGQPIKMEIDPSMINYAILCYSSLGPSFGTGHDIYIESNWNSYSQLGFTYKHSIYANDQAKAHSFLAGSSDFQVTEIEVFQII